MSRRALITGVTGVLGRELAGCLRRRGYAVYGAARRPLEGWQDGLDWLPIECDVTDDASVLRAIRLSRPELIFHLAAAQASATLRPSQNGTNPGQKFSGAEGLRHVVVCTQFQSQHLVQFSLFGRKHQDGNRTAAPNFAADGESVHLGKHDIEDHQVKGGLPHLLHGSLPVVGHVHFVAFPFQVELQDVCNGPFVVHHQYSLRHGCVNPLFYRHARTFDCRIDSSSQGSKEAQAVLGCSLYAFEVCLHPLQPLGKEGWRQKAGLSL